MKDLFKPGRPINEYLNPDGSLKIDCLTCKHRNHIPNGKLGGWLCSGQDEMHKKCNPKYHESYDNKFEYILWEARVNNGMFQENEFILV